MDETAFWTIVDATRRQAEGDPDEHIEALTTALADLPEAEIVAFGRIFDEFWARAYTWDLWAAAYILGGGCSDDGFMDFLGWLISQGPKVYAEALADPDSLAGVLDEGEDGQIEGFHYVAGQAWAQKTGGDYADFPASDVHPPAEPTGEPWDEDDAEALAARFPKLFAKFWEA